MALEQHAIPTEVTKYQFRLIGDWTITQFAWLAGGIILAIIFSALPLPLIKYPLMFISVMGGIAVAFLPYEGRTLDRWAVAFIKAIYSPTEFVWRKEETTPPYLQPVKHTPLTAHELAASQSQPEERYLSEYLHSLSAQYHTLDDPEEAARLQQINQLLAGNTATAPPMARQAASTSPPANPTAPSDPVPNQAQPITDQSAADPSQALASTPVQPQTSAAPAQAPASADSNQTAPLTQATPPAPSPSQAQPAISHPTSAPAMPEPGVPPASASASQPAASPTTADQQTLSQPQVQPAVLYTSQQFPHLPPPPSPAADGLVSGVVVDPNQQPVGNAIVEIQDAQSQVLRVLRTNQQGVFATAAPLPAGEYYLVCEHQPQTKYQLTLQPGQRPVLVLTTTSTVESPL